MTERRTLMQILDDWKLLECDPFPPKGRNERAEAFANLFALMKKEGYTRTEIERKMLSPLLDLCISPRLKDKKLIKSLAQSTEQAFRRGLSIVFIEEYDNEVRVDLPEVKDYGFKTNDSRPVFRSVDTVPAAKDRKTIKYDEVPDSGFDFGFGGLFEELEREIAEKEGKDE